MEKLTPIIDQFRVEGQVVQVIPITTGWINQTYQVLTRDQSTPDYILQRVNHHIFEDVDLLQSNVKIVTDHIRGKLLQQGVENIDSRVLRLIETKTGALYLKQEDVYWRMLYKVPNCQSFDVVNPHFAQMAGEAFGAFHTQLSDIDVTQLGETIPNFHNMEFRLQQFKQALDADLSGRRTEVSALVDELLGRAEDMCKAERLYREGKLRKRVNHCDTKVNNMLFDQQGNVLCIIDLDTVMPGFVLSDFGDFMRTAANTAAEDEADLSKIDFNMDIFRAYTTGYLSVAQFLTPLEKQLLPYGAKLLTYMQTVRFLTDYLNGDTYYKILFADHNLVRSKAQFKLLTAIEAREPEMDQFIAGFGSK